MTEDIGRRGEGCPGTDPSVTDDVILAEWDPQTSVNVHTAREQAKRAVEWLRQDGRRRVRAEFIAALADESPLENGLWWGGAVHPGLHLFVEVGRVEYWSESQEYRWIGESEVHN